MTGPERPWAGGSWETVVVKGEPLWRRKVARLLVALLIAALVVPFAFIAWGLWLAHDDWQDAEAQTYELDMMIGMTPGTCLDRHGVSLRRAPCSNEHDGEITAVVPLGTSDYAGDKLVRESSARRCQRATKDWLKGGLGEDLDLKLGFYYPTPQGWAAGNTAAYCYAVLPNGETTEGTFAGRPS